MPSGYVSLLQRDVVGFRTPRGHHDNTIQYEYTRIHILGSTYTNSSQRLQRLVVNSCSNDSVLLTTALIPTGAASW